MPEELLEQDQVGLAFQGGFCSIVDATPRQNLCIILELSYVAGIVPISKGQRHVQGPQGATACLKAAVLECVTELQNLEQCNMPTAVVE